MPDHAHAIIFPEEEHYSISAILKSIKQPVARQATNHLRSINSEWLKRLEVRRPTGRIEHRFWQQGGRYDRNITDVATLWKMIHYIHDNPVRKALVGASAEWNWSSAKWYAGKEDCILEIDPPPVH